MSYTVIKWVRGRPYLYRQRSFREGGAVRTVSTYLGPAGDAADPAHRSQALVDRTADQGTASPAVTPRSVPVPDSLSITADLDRLGVSAQSLRYHYTEALRRLAGIGIDPAAVPPIVVRHGFGVDVKRRWRGGYAVTLPPGRKVKAAAVRAAFHRALARACLDAVREQRPDRYAALSLHLDQSFRATNAAVIRYVSNTRIRGAWAWMLTLRFFGIAHALKRPGGVEAQTIGLAEFGPRARWQDEAAAVLGQVLARGFAASWRIYEHERAKAEAAEAAAARAWRAAGLFGRREARRRWRRAQARLIAQAEHGEKLLTLRAVFGLAPAPSMGRQAGARGGDATGRDGLGLGRRASGSE